MNQTLPEFQERITFLSLEHKTFIIPLGIFNDRIKLPALLASTHDFIFNQTPTF